MKITRVENGVGTFTTLKQMKAEHPNVSFRKEIPENGIEIEGIQYFPTVTAQAPTPTTGFNIKPKSHPELIKGAWTHGFDLVPIEVTNKMIDIERDRRINSGFIWQGKLWQSDQDSRENINGAYSSALAYLLSGGQPDEVYWSDPITPLTWIAEDNSMTIMTPSMLLDFGNTALAHKKAHIFAGRALKDMITLPTDYTDNRWWP